MAVVNKTRNFVLVRKIIEMIKKLTKKLRKNAKMCRDLLETTENKLKFEVNKSWGGRISNLSPAPKAVIFFSL